MRVYRLEIQSVMLVFSTHRIVAPLTFSLVQLSPPSLCEQIYGIHVYINTYPASQNNADPQPSLKETQIISIWLYDCIISSEGH